VGSRHEGYGESGMAHLLEHMVFKGTPKHPDIPQELTSHGCRPNGSTWFDRTNYFETFAATEENLDWALDLEADRMVNSFIAKKDLDSEMTVVRNEFEIGENSPQEVLLDRVMSAAYLWHNYGKSTIGSRVDLERVPIDSLQAFYKKWYQPDNAVLVVAGKFDEARTLGKIAEIRQEAHAAPAVHVHDRARAGRRARGDAAARGRRPDRGGRLPRARGLARRLPGGRAAVVHPRRRAVGPSLQGSGRDEEGLVGLRRSLPVP
jgi:zinc protease